LSIEFILNIHFPGVKCDHALMIEGVSSSTCPFHWLLLTAYANVNTLEGFFIKKMRTREHAIMLLHQGLLPVPLLYDSRPKRFYRLGFDFNIEH